MNFNKPVQLNFQKKIFFPVENSEACIFMTIIFYNKTIIVTVFRITFENKGYLLQ